ncbi:hypothetical protein [Helicobacter mustelae]|uniref:Uncharacterized protein n=1 Tax=Helicobacter mustelae (strain ATCC 43772 / CCUG 25715 / CIP 103759 / LMG 18044 / NCTC 12198 / R85-136P) TaxID=679897 RepID=D3UHY0_HELM1|nr:hypothetical protein [Helicobacter mustelae]CBG40103.1 Putative hypothetical protein [Helicobacter mustelae 12198]SQH71617.1 integral membrane protein [Helicobacter mustelae]STP12742.1 integral membrane protein [Helicobacter mustelae]
MFRILLRLIFAGCIAWFWHYINPSDPPIISVSVFLLVFFILTLRPIGFSFPLKREEYIHQMRKKNERLLAIEEKKKEERERAKKLTRLKKEKNQSNL